MKEKREKTQINKIRYERGDIKTNNTGKQRIIRANIMGVPQLVSATKVAVLKFKLLRMLPQPNFTNSKALVI